VTGRPETTCPRTNVLGPLVPILIIPCWTISLDWYIPVILNTCMYCIMQIMTGMYQCWDNVFLGRFWGSQNFNTGTHCFGTSRHPTILPVFCAILGKATPPVPMSLPTVSPILLNTFLLPMSSVLFTLLLTLLTIHSDQSCSHWHLSCLYCHLSCLHCQLSCLQ